MISPLQRSRVWGATLVEPAGAVTSQPWGPHRCFPFCCCCSVRPTVPSGCHPTSSTANGASKWAWPLKNVMMARWDEPPPRVWPTRIRRRRMTGNWAQRNYRAFRLCIRLVWYFRKLSWHADSPTPKPLFDPVIRSANHESLGWSLKSKVGNVWVLPRESVTIHEKTSLWFAFENRLTLKGGSTAVKFTIIPAPGIEVSIGYITLAAAANTRRRATGGQKTTDQLLGTLQLVCYDYAMVCRSVDGLLTIILRKSH